VAAPVLAIAATVEAQDAILPEKDPPPTSPAVTYLAPIANRHPRVLLTAESLPRLRAFYDSPDCKLYRDQLEAQIRRCTVPADRKMGSDWGRAQTIGLFSLPPVALHYALTGNKDSFEKGVAYLRWLAGQADWSDGGEPAVPDQLEEYARVLDRMKQFGPKGERNSDIAASFTMVGATLLWDWLYNDLDPAFREQFRQILWQHARAMYYGGHLKRNPGGSYWHGAPNYNHRWYRTWGLALAALATGEGKPEEQWLLSEVRKELQFNVTWLPNDGSQHEGPGYGSCAGALGVALQVSDELTGTRFLESPFFAGVAPYAVHISTPGMKESFYFSDCFDKAVSFHPYFLRTAATHRQADVLDGIRHALRVNSGKWGIKDYAWLAILADDPDIQGGDFRRLPTAHFLPDLGITLVRDSWADDAVGARFKCGPLGGYRSNAWLASRDAAGRSRPNVAHDHPDANSFTLFARGEYLAETDRYPIGKDLGKLSTGHNTILVNGIGQAPQGRAEGEDWMQPGTGDLTEYARVVAFRDAGPVVFTEGEAAGAYLAYHRGEKKRPGLDRFRRTFIWVKEGYVLVVDDVRAPAPVDITWLIQGAQLNPVAETEGRYQLAKGSSDCEFQLIADMSLRSKIAVSTANNHGKLMNWQQLQAVAEQTRSVRYVCILDPWRKNARVALSADGPDRAVIHVTGTGIDDTWQWTAAPGRFEAATWHGSRPGGFDLIMDSRTAAPPAP